ncbi:MAG: hydrogenase maturation nickel metallochaperone HypA [Anaerolineae bacterium UTCFX2]|jgi:hydrogenase nickel incorporation protein HypA/HybF|nr:hydrogenase maturation nickel metallochaperone HypA [Anaerolineae bacterium]MCZ7551754.1 hydrogenase maturation nickel metallochaperone HypA [Anaerolineales bacterium]OQY90141.1 MAG: hydrogenase maturation nickel metallochaperone HypA [Anaerolineae bacterium UTCFX2]
MHELAVTESILEITLRYAKQAQARRVVTLNLVIGELASIVDDSVQFYWDIISKDTPAEGARLNFRRVPFELLCLECTERFTPRGESFACPRCGSERIQVAAGEEFYLDSIEVE